MLTFAPDIHEYRWNDRIVSSVTTILKSLGLIDTTWYTDEARDRGSMIHLATALDDRGELDEASVDERIAGYLDAWRHWRRVSGFEIETIELPAYSVELDYAGTDDRSGKMRSISTVVDIKAGQPEPWHKLQTAAYAIARYGFSVARSVVNRAVVYLDDNGAYRMKTHSDKNDFDAWRACVSLYNWKVSNA